MDPTVYSLLIATARAHMLRSRDPIHECCHAERVVTFAQKLCQTAQVSKAEEDTLIIAAWWHDVSRNMTKKPSLIWMPIVDDMLSAAMLFWYLLRHRITDKHARLAARLILCKSIGTGTFWKKILLNRHECFLADLLDDADTLDTFAIERIRKLFEMIDASRLYRIGYRVLCRWFTLARQLRTKTAAAKTYITELLRQFISWLKGPRIFAWHVKHFGIRWARKSLQRLEYTVYFLHLSSFNG